MGTTRYTKAITVLKKYMDDSGRDFIYTQDLRALIMRHIGGDETRVIIPTLKMLRDLNIIEEVTLNKWNITLKGGKNGSND